MPVDISGGQRIDSESNPIRESECESQGESHLECESAVCVISIRLLGYDFFPLGQRLWKYQLSPSQSL